MPSPPKTEARTYRRRNSGTHAPEGPGGPGPAPTEEKNPAVGAAMLDAATDPTLQRIVDLAQAAGVSASMMQAFLTRMRGRYQPFDGQIRKVRAERIQALVEDRIERTLEYLDDTVLAQADARSLAVVFGILFDKLQLAKGQPTAILSVQERGHLEAMMPALMREASRRGITIDLDGSGYRQLTPDPMRPLERKLETQRERGGGVGGDG